MAGFDPSIEAPAAAKVRILYKLRTRWRRDLRRFQVYVVTKYYV